MDGKLHAVDANTGTLCPDFDCSRTVKGLREDGIFTPPSLQGTLTYPPTSGGIEWGGSAVDPVNQIYYVNSSSIAQIFKLIPRAATQSLNRRLAIKS